MLKRCSRCATEYFARWRNEPVTLCPACRAEAVCCASCGALVKPLTDHEQLELFIAVYVAPRRVDAPTHEERYWSLRAKASQATRRKYPYQ